MHSYIDGILGCEGRDGMGWARLVELSVAEARSRGRSPVRIIRRQKAHAAAGGMEVLAQVPAGGGGSAYSGDAAAARGAVADDSSSCAVAGFRSDRSTAASSSTLT